MEIDGGGMRFSASQDATAPTTPWSRSLYQGALIVTHRDRVCGPSGRREAAGDVVHRQGVPTPSDGPHTRPKRRLPRAFGQRRARLPMPGIGAAHAPCRKPWEDVSMSHYHRSLVLCDNTIKRMMVSCRRALCACRSMQPLGREGWTGWREGKTMIKAAIIGLGRWG